MISALRGHWWTVWPSVAHTLRPETPPPSRPWSTTAEDHGRRIVLTGLWSERPATVAVLVIHGLGGSVERPYCVRAARAVDDHGWSCLRLALRGADGHGEDFYHAGLTEDLDAALRSPVFFGFDRIAILGYSLGGHVALRYATRDPDPRVVGVAAVCAPLDLAPAADHLDRPACTLYRRHVLRGLRELYGRVAERGPVPTHPLDLEQVDSIREWDSRTVVPRYGFDSVDHYYESQSVGPRCEELRIPALVVSARHDPMVPHRLVEARLRQAPSAVESWVLHEAGHVGYPAGLRRRPEGRPGVEQQILQWFEEKLG